MRGFGRAAIGLLATIGVVMVGHGGELSAQPESTRNVSSEPSTASRERDFVQWINEFRAEALAQGISGATFDFAFADVGLNQSVLDSNEKQPEFERQIWTYVAGAVSTYRIEQGQKLLRQHKALLDDIQQSYGVDRQYLMAIWGLETSFGKVKGNIYAVEALATLAFRGRRTAYGRRELLALLTILEKGYATKFQLFGSWAGAMGHTQFIPSAYLAYGVDHDGDGKRDLWSSLPDVFASTANYLSQARWRPGQTWGREVVLPEGFDYSLADRTIVKSVADWTKRGVRAARGTLESDKNIVGVLLLPGGYNGPAFLVYHNYRALMTYNNSTAYALAVAHLADRIKGGATFKGTWPVDEPALSKADRFDLQGLLIALGYDPGEADGIVGQKTRAAFRLYQQDIGEPADGFPTQTLLARLRRDTAQE